MRVVRIILFILGGLLIVANLLAFLALPPRPNASELAYQIAFYIGYSFPFLIGGIFILIGYRIGKNIKRKKEKQQAEQLIDSLPK